MMPVLKKHFKSWNPKFQCLVHGEPHLGNMWIYKGAPRFLDWQGIQVGSAIGDVAYFASGSLTVEDRRAHEMRILDHYLSALHRFGGPSLSSKDEDVMVEYHKFMLAGYGWFMAPYELQSEARVRVMSERHSAAVVDHKTVELVESMPDVAQTDTYDIVRAMNTLVIMYLLGVDSVHRMLKTPSFYDH